MTTKEQLAQQANWPELALVPDEDLALDFHEGHFLPEGGRLKDLDIPTTEYKGKEDIGGATVKFTIEVPDEITDPFPMIYAPGYFAKGAYDDLRSATARNGKVGITFDTPRSHKNFAGLHPKHIISPERLLAQSVHAAIRGTKRMAEETGIEASRFDLSGHSMAGRSVILAALHRPKDVRTVILNQASGLFDHNTLQLLKSLSVFTKDELIPAINSRDFIEITLNGIYYVCRNPLKTAVEGIASSNCNIRPAIKELGKQGIKTAIMVGESDRLISAEETRLASLDLPDIFVTFSDPDANHLAPQKLPFMVAMAHKQTLGRLHPQSLALVQTTAA